MLIVSISHFTFTCLIHTVRRIRSRTSLQRFAKLMRLGPKERERRRKGHSPKTQAAPDRRRCATDVRRALMHTACRDNSNASAVLLRCANRPLTVLAARNFRLGRSLRHLPSPALALARLPFSGSRLLAAYSLTSIGATCVQADASCNLKHLVPVQELCGICSRFRQTSKPHPEQDSYRFEDKNAHGRSGTC
jgi:hypothetical protein